MDYVFLKTILMIHKELEKPEIKQTNLLSNIPHQSSQVQSYYSSTHVLCTTIAT